MAAAPRHAFNNSTYVLGVGSGSARTMSWIRMDGGCYAGSVKSPYFLVFNILSTYIHLQHTTTFVRPLAHSIQVSKDANTKENCGPALSHPPSHTPSILYTQPSPSSPLPPSLSTSLPLSVSVSICLSV